MLLHLVNVGDNGDVGNVGDGETLLFVASYHWIDIAIV